MNTEKRAEHLRQQIERALADLCRSDADLGDGPAVPAERACKPAMEALAAVREDEPPDPTELARLGEAVAELEVHLRPQYDSAAHTLLHAGEGMVELAEEIAGNR